MRRSSRPRRRPPSQRKPASPPPPPPQRPAPASAEDVERALERRVKLQRAMTSEVRRTADAYRETAELQGALAEDLALERYRNPHDKSSLYDRLDRKDPARPTFAHLALSTPGMLHRMRAVPPRAVDEYAEDDDGEFALISCPCGAKPIARAPIEKCPGCERYYTILGGKRAIVIYGAMAVPGAAPIAEPVEPTCSYGTCDGGGLIYEEATNTTYDCQCRAELIANRRRGRS